MGWRSHVWEEIVEEGDWVKEKFLRVDGVRSWDGTGLAACPLPVTARGGRAIRTWEAKAPSQLCAGPTGLLLKSLSLK